MHSVSSLLRLLVIKIMNIYSYKDRYATEIGTDIYKIYIHSIQHAYIMSVEDINLL